MQFEALDRTMRVYETAHDHRVLPGLWMVARLDGRSFTRLVREVHQFEAPFDPRFRDLMVATARHLMDCGFNVIYANTHSDEISLLFHPSEDSFGRKLRKLLSILAGEASAAFSLQLGAVAAFDARISQLPSAQLVVDYFRWRAEDAHRNALNAHCYWLLRGQGLDGRAADTHPGDQAVRPLVGGVDALLVQRRPVGAAPGDRLAAEAAGEDRQPLVEQQLVVGGFEAEQRERLGE